MRGENIRRDYLLREAVRLFGRQETDASRIYDGLALVTLASVYVAQDGHADSVSDVVGRSDG